MKHCLFISPRVSDKEVFLRAFRRMAPGDRCDVASDAYEAFKMLREWELVPDLVCVEREMRAVDGLEFLRMCKRIERLKDIPVIVHTVSIRKDEVDELRDSGALAVFIRPFDFYSVCTMLAFYFGFEPITISQN
jgi:CheY-like chemotaxis protein